MEAKWSWDRLVALEPSRIRHGTGTEPSRIRHGNVTELDSLARPG